MLGGSQSDNSFIASLGGGRHGIVGFIQSALRGGNSSEREFGEGLSVVRDATNRDRFYVVGNNTDRFMNYWENASDYTEVANDAPCQLTYIRASDIEGIYLSRREVDDASVFWGRRTGGTQESFIEIADQVSQVREYLDSGLNYSDIRETHPELSDCVGIYFESAPDVCSLDDFYVFNSNGRHRIMAASSIDTIIPVRVRGQYVRRDTL